MLTQARQFIQAVQLPCQRGLYEMVSGKKANRESQDGVLMAIACKRPERDIHPLDGSAAGY